MLGRRLPKVRRFSYQPYYYDPEKEEREGRKIKFRRMRSSKSVKRRSLIWLFIILAFIIYFIIMLRRIG